MDSTWGEDYDALADVARSVFARRSPLDDRSNSPKYTEQHEEFRTLDWLQLTDVTGTLGDSAALGSIAAIFVEMGRALVQTPLLDLMIAREIASASRTVAGLDLAERIGEGQRSVMPIVSDVCWDNDLRLVGGNLEGTALAVPYATDADSFIVDCISDQGRALVLVDAHAGIHIEPMPNISDDSMFAVVFASVPVETHNIFATADAAERIRSMALDRAAVLRAAQVYGAGSRLLDMVVRYATERHQFGGPIGRFQAVQYLCTDIAIDVHLTSLHARSAAQALDDGLEPQPHLAIMRKQATKAATGMVHAAHEVHAGIGYMVESNVHLFTSAAKRWQYDFGTDHANDKAIVQALELQYEGVPA